LLVALSANALAVAKQRITLAGRAGRKDYVTPLILTNSAA